MHGMATIAIILKITSWKYKKEGHDAKKKRPKMKAKREKRKEGRRRTRRRSKGRACGARLTGS